MTFNLAMSWGQQPFACFMAGVLVPTFTYFYITRKGGRDSDLTVPQDGEWEDSDSDEDVDERLAGGDNPSASWSIIDAPYKMVLCVNTSLGMGKGE